MKVLLVAEAANPNWTSVPLVGWSHAMALREVADVHLVTQVRNAEAIRTTGVWSDDQWTAIDSEPVARPLHRMAHVLRGGAGKGWTTVTAINAVSYYYFEHLVWQQFRQRLRSGEFDLVHRLTPLSPTIPSRLAAKCRRAGVPFVLGPLNGGVPWPEWFDRERRQEKEWLAPLRNGYKLMPGYSATRRHSAAILVGSRDTLAQLDRQCWHKTFYVAENAIDPGRFPMLDRRPADIPLQLLFLGRLVPYKGADMVIEAAGRLLASGRARLTIVGDGPQREALEQKAAAFDCPGTVNFAGNVSHQEVCRYYAESDVLTFPSIREFGGGVVLEAMAMGCVPMVVKYGGPAELIDEQTGFGLEIGPREQIVRELRDQLERLVDDPDCLAKMSTAAIDHARGQFTWSAKAEQVHEVYRWVLDGGPKPAFAVEGAAEV